MKFKDHINKANDVVLSEKLIDGWAQLNHFCLAIVLYHIAKVLKKYLKVHSQV